MLEKQSAAQPNPGYSELLRLSQAMGVLKWAGPGKFQNIKLAFHPFQSTKAYHQYLAKLHQTWHRVLLRVAQDRPFLITLFSEIAGGDEILKGVLEIVKKRGPSSLQDGVCLDRIDYYNNEEGQPKLTEFNLQCVGMMSHMERFQDAKRLAEGNDPSYVSSPTIQSYVEAVQQIMNLKKLDGVLLFVIYCIDQESDANFLDQARFQIEYRKKGIKVIRTNLKEMASKLLLKESGDLYYGEERVAVVYNRNLYKASHYKFEEGYDVANSWKAREKVALSNAISIPPIQFELVNEKRMQTELAKPEVLRRYASEEEAELLAKTRVSEWEFDSITEEGLSALAARVQAAPDAFLLKPNMEGGGNNLFGQDILQKLRGDRQTLRSYILMQKIKTNPSLNVIIGGSNSCMQQCDYQISRYGSLTWFNGKIVRNQADGFLIRAKPTNANQGGIMTGVGSIVSWKLTS